MLSASTTKHVDSSLRAGRSGSCKRAGRRRQRSEVSPPPFLSIRVGERRMPVVGGKQGSCLHPPCSTSWGNKQATVCALGTPVAAVCFNRRRSMPLPPPYRAGFRLPLHRWLLASSWVVCRNSRSSVSPLLCPRQRRQAGLRQTTLHAYVMDVDMPSQACTAYSSRTHSEWTAARGLSMMRAGVHGRNVAATPRPTPLAICVLKCQVSENDSSRVISLANCWILCYAHQNDSSGRQDDSQWSAQNPMFSQ